MQPKAIRGGQHHRLGGREAEQAGIGHLAEREVDETALEDPNGREQQDRQHDAGRQRAYQAAHASPRHPA
jgi:hypothetical protein